MSKKAFVTKEMIEEIVKTYPTPFHIYDEKGIKDAARKRSRFRRGRGARQNLKVFYIASPPSMRMTSPVM